MSDIITDQATEILDLKRQIAKLSGISIILHPVNFTVTYTFDLTYTGDFVDHKALCDVVVGKVSKIKPAVIKYLKSTYGDKVMING